MIRTLHTCNIDRYTVIEDTKNLNLLRMWYNPLPAKWFKKRIDKFFSDFKKIVNVNEMNGELTKEKSRILTYRKILQLSTTYDALWFAFQEAALKDTMQVFTKADIKHRMSFDYYCASVLKLTGIDIKTPKDLVKLSNEIKRRQDKYNQLYMVKEAAERESISFAQYASGVFAFMDSGFNGNMSLYQFGELKKNYDLKVWQLEKNKVNG